MRLSREHAAPGQGEGDTLLTESPCGSAARLHLHVLARGRRWGQGAALPREGPLGRSQGVSEESPGSQSWPGSWVRVWRGLPRLPEQGVVTAGHPQLCAKAKFKIGVFLDF